MNSSEPSFSLSEFIGLVIIFLSFLFSALRRVWEFFDRRKNPEKYVKKEQDADLAMQDMMRKLHEELDIPKPAPQYSSTRYEEAPKPKPIVKQPAKPMREAKRTVGNNFQFKSGLDTYHSKSAIDDRRFQSAIENRSGDDLVSSALQDLERPEVVDDHFDSNPSAASQLIHGMGDPLDMLIIHEIFSPPLSLRNRE